MEIAYILFQAYGMTQGIGSCACADYCKSDLRLCFHWCGHSAPDDLQQVSTLRSLLEDLREIRLRKARQGLSLLNPGAYAYVKVSAYVHVRRRHGPLAQRR